MKLSRKTSIVIIFFFISFLSVHLRPSLISGELKGQTDQRENEAGISGLLRDLGERTSGIKSIKTDFIQEKDLAIFRNKITLKGKIYLQKPYKLAWFVDEPMKYKVIITDKLIRQWDEDTNEIHEISISGNTIFQNIIDQLSVWFSGNYISLLENYDVTIKDRQPLVLEFIPKDRNMAKKIIKSITVMFRDDLKYLKQIEFQEISGDSTLIVLKNTELNVPLDDSYFTIKPVKKQALLSVMSEGVS